MDRRGRHYEPQISRRAWGLAASFWELMNPFVVRMPEREGGGLPTVPALRLYARSILCLVGGTWYTPWPMGNTAEKSLMRWAPLNGVCPRCYRRASVGAGSLTRSHRKSLYSSDKVCNTTSPSRHRLLRFAASAIWCRVRVCARIAQNILQY